MTTARVSKAPRGGRWGVSAERRAEIETGIAQQHCARGQVLSFYGLCLTCGERHPIAWVGRLTIRRRTDRGTVPRLVKLCEHCARTETQAKERIATVQQAVNEAARKK